MNKSLRLIQNRVRQKFLFVTFVSLTTSFVSLSRFIIDSKGNVQVNVSVRIETL